MAGIRVFCSPQRIFFLIWTAAAILAGSVLASYHQPFGLPSGSIVPLATESQGWRALHLLTAGCGCSDSLAGYLAKRRPFPGLSEEVIFIGADDPFGKRAALESDGFRVSSHGSEYIRAIGVTGVPLLVILSPSGKAVYMGGYGAGGYRDAELWTKIRSGLEPPALPVLGCAVSKDLRNRIDPLGWKYRF
jgi:hypothetical protein